MLVVACIALVVLIFTASSVILKPFNVLEYSVVTGVDKGMGFNFEYSCFDFGKSHSVIQLGTVKPGDSTGRSISITNGERKSRVSLKSSGELSDWLKFSENNFILEPNQNKNIELTAKIPEDAEYGNYTSTLFIKFYRTL